MNDYQMGGTSRYGEVKELGDRVQTFKIERARSFTGPSTRATPRTSTT